MSKTNNKDLNKLFKSLEKQGWRIDHGRHFQCYSPNGVDIVNIAGTSSSCALHKSIKRLTDAGAKL